MAQQLKQPAKGNGANTGSPGPTPAPRAPFVNPNLALTRVSNPGYGSNNDPSPASVAPGKKLSTKLGDELRNYAQTDGELDRIINEGTARREGSVTGQLRDIAAKNVASHPFMKSPNRPAGSFDTLPQKIGASAGQPVRKPGR
jgi:hypothetical protein